MINRMNSFGWLVLLVVAGFVCLAVAQVTQPCKCVCKFAKPQIVNAGKEAAPGGGTRYSFSPNVTTDCTGEHCTKTSVDYKWTIAGGGTAAVVGSSTNEMTLRLDVTAAGNFDLTCMVKVTCSDGTMCTFTGTRKFHLKP